MRDKESYENGLLMGAALASEGSAAGGWLSFFILVLLVLLGVYGVFAVIMVSWLNRAFLRHCYNAADAAPQRTTAQMFCAHPRAKAQSRWHMRCFIAVFVSYYAFYLYYKLHGGAVPSLLGYTLCAGFILSAAALIGLGIAMSVPALSAKRKADKQRRAAENDTVR